MEEKVRRYYNESKTISKTFVRKVQDYQKKRKGYGNLRKSKAQTKTRLMDKLNIKTTNVGGVA